MTLEALDGLRLQSVDNSNRTGGVPLSCKIPSCNDPPVIYCEHVKCEKLMCGKHLEVKILRVAHIFSHTTLQYRDCVAVGYYLYCLKSR